MTCARARAEDKEAGRTCSLWERNSAVGVVAHTRLAGNEGAVLSVIDVGLYVITVTLLESVFDVLPVFLLLSLSSWPEAPGSIPRAASIPTSFNCNIVLGYPGFK
jgi:hypothetical protein